MNYDGATTALSAALQIPESEADTILSELTYDLWRLREQPADFLNDRLQPLTLHQLRALRNILDCLADPQPRRSIATPGNIATLLRPWASDGYEHVWVFTLDAMLPWPGQTPAPGIINIHKIASGSPNQVTFTPAQVFRPAIVDKAAAIIIAHTHAHDNAIQTYDDVTGTRALAIAAQQLGIQILDHLIVSRQNIFSMKEAGISGL